MKLRFELRNYDARLLDEYEVEKTDRLIKYDINDFNDFIIELKSNEFDIEEIDEYKFEVDNLSEGRFDFLIAALDVLDEGFEVCSIYWDEL